MCCRGGRRGRPSGCRWHRCVDGRGGWDQARPPLCRGAPGVVGVRALAYRAGSLPSPLALCFEASSGRGAAANGLSRGARAAAAVATPTRGCAWAPGRPLRLAAECVRPPPRQVGATVARGAWRSAGVAQPSALSWLPAAAAAVAVAERSGNRWGWRRQQPRRQVLGSGLPWLLTLAPFVFTRTFFSVCAAAGGSKREQVGRGTHGGPGKALLLVRPPRAGMDVATCSVEATRALMTRRPSHGGRGGEGEKTATIRPYQHK